MGDKKRGFVLCKLRKFTVKFTFRHRIQLARRLIQDQNGSVAHQGPGQSNPLPLPSGKIYTSLKIPVQHGIFSLWQTFQKRQHISLLHRLSYRLPVRKLLHISDSHVFP